MIQERIRQGVYVKDVAAGVGSSSADGEPGAATRRFAAGRAAGGPARASWIATSR